MTSAPGFPAKSTPACHAIRPVIGSTRRPNPDDIQPFVTGRPDSATASWNLRLDSSDSSTSSSSSRDSSSRENSASCAEKSVLTPGSVRCTLLRTTDRRCFAETKFRRIEIGHFADSFTERFHPQQPGLHHRQAPADRIAIHVRLLLEPRDLALLRVERTAPTRENVFVEQVALREASEEICIAAQRGEENRGDHRKHDTRHTPGLSSTPLFPQEYDLHRFYFSNAARRCSSFWP